MKHTFTKADEGKQFICIHSKNKTSDIIRELENRIPDVSKALFSTTGNELLLDLDFKIDYGMSLKETARLVKSIDERATVSYIIIDFQRARKSGRYTILKH